MNNFARDNFLIYKKADLLDYALCPIRGEISLPYYKPEEKVRLSLLHFLTGCQDIYPSKVDLRVENERLDISIFDKGLNELLSYQPPAVIIETKRQEYDLINAHGQLVEYLKKKKTNSGLLFNLTQAFAVNKVGNDYQRNELVSSDQIIEFITISIHQQNEELSEETEFYRRATEGDFESFRFLATKYRRNKRISFVIRQNSLDYLIEGHLFDFGPEDIRYVKCGLDTKSENKPSFVREEFVCLHKIFSH